MKLSSSRAAVTISPDDGGRIGSLMVDGHELLVAETENPVTWGSYPMVPFAGRIDRGILDFDGNRITLPTNDGPHALHGYGFTSRWTPTDAHHIRYDFAAPWPFAGHAIQSFALTDTDLTLSMTVVATERQPIIIGWHPWFRRVIDGHTADLDFAAISMYELDASAIPTGNLITPPAGPWDNCFTGIQRSPILRWGELAVSLTSSTDHWVVYDMPEHALCVEPQTLAPNAINHGEGIVEADGTLTTWFRISWG